MIYKHIVLGGTFDRLHEGHISYLKTAFENANRVTIGLTTDRLHNDKELKQIVEEYDLRKKELLKVIKARWPQVEVAISPIDDIFGPSITDPSMDAIIVTENTLENGKKVNKKRVARGLGELKIVVVPIINAQDQKSISSGRIRLGEIDREGNVYKRSFSRTIKLPETLRPELRIALGNVIKGTETDKDRTAFKVKKLLENEKYTLSIAVGDVVSSTLEKAGFSPDIKVIDFKTQRKFLPSFYKVARFDVGNTAGTVDSLSAKFLEKEIKEVVRNKIKRTITVDGEEDLLVLPVILMSPLESVVFYGQRNVGIVMVIVTEEIKKQVSELVKRFT